MQFSLMACKTKLILIKFASVSQIEECLSEFQFICSTKVNTIFSFQAVFRLKK